MTQMYNPNEDKYEFRTDLGRNVFLARYALTQSETWRQRAKTIVDDVCGTRGGTRHPILSKEELDLLVEAISTFKFLPGGRYIYYAGRDACFYNNCYLFKSKEDSREEWAALVERVTSALMTGGGVGNDYSVFRSRGSMLRRTGGQASGPIPLMYMINEIGRNVMQGGSRRSAIYASLNWAHEDINEFLRAKDWDSQPISGTGLTFGDVKKEDFNFPCPLDMTNISLNYDDAWLDLKERHKHPTFLDNVYFAMRNGEPGFSFNFGDKQYETARNAPVSADTRVLTATGYETVGDIVGRPVTIWTGKRWTKTGFKKTKENVKTVEVLLNNGRSIFCDPEHPFLVWDKSGITRVAASDLKDGCSLCCDLPKDIPHAPLNNEEYGYGFVWGDGHIRAGRGDIQVFEENKLECFNKVVEGLAGYRCSMPNRAYFYTSYGTKPFFLTESFIAGWFDADGSFSRDMLRLSSTDRDKLLMAREELDMLGIKSVVREDGKCNFGTNNPMYTLHVYKESHNRFLEVIPTIRVKPEPVDSVRQQNIKVVKVVNACRTEDVYCCDVGVEEHSFMAEGVLISNCTEVTSEDDSDVCNLGSLNLGAIESLEEFEKIVAVASKFLVCGTIRGELPTKKIEEVREKNRRLGLGLMGVHEWLLKRGLRYEPNTELTKWLEVYQRVSESAAVEHCDRLYISHPVAYRAIAPTGTIGILAGTTGGIEPLYAVAYKRRYLVDGTKYKYEYVVDHTAQTLIDVHGVDPNSIETAAELAQDPERRIAFQAYVQDYVDMAISSTLNLPTWGSKYNNEDKVLEMAEIISKYAPRLRGLTFYPDGARGGQPITQIPYEEALKHKGLVYEENIDCGASGVCGV